MAARRAVSRLARRTIPAHGRTAHRYRRASAQSTRPKPATRLVRVRQAPRPVRQERTRVSADLTRCPRARRSQNIAACVCEAPNTANDLGVCIPPPTQCPSDEYGTPPNCQVIPQCSAVVGGYWGGPAAGCQCPASEDRDVPSVCRPALPSGHVRHARELFSDTCLQRLPGSSYWGGNQCECPATYTGTYPSCLPPPTACNTIDPSATGNFPNCSCPAGEVWDSSRSVHHTDHKLSLDLSASEWRVACRVAAQSRRCGTTRR